MPLRRWAGRHISPHFFHLAFLVLALRLAFPVDVSLPAAPVQVEMPAAITVAADAETAQPVPRTAQPQQKTEQQAVSLDLSAVWDLLPYVWALGRFVRWGFGWVLTGVHRAPAQPARSGGGQPADDGSGRGRAACPCLSGGGTVFADGGGSCAPRGVSARCQPDQTLPYVMAHEIRHLKRGDLWFKFL